MKTSTDTVYRRDCRLNWFRNGTYTTTVPEHVLKLAAGMAIECSITVPAKKQRAQKLQCQCDRPGIVECDMHGPTE